MAPGNFNVLKCVQGLLFTHAYSTYISASCRLCLVLSDRIV